MSETVVDPGSPAAEHDSEFLPPLFILGIALFAILVSAAVTLALVTSLQGP